MRTLITTSIASFLASVGVRLLIEASLVTRVSIAGSFIGLERTDNSGIAFGISMPPLLQSFLIACALLLVFFLAHQTRTDKKQAISFGLIIGGALANIIDRFNDGFVTDFIQIGWWPTFNIADSCITIGVLLLLFFEWKKGSK